MRIFFALVAAGAFFLSGCKTTESASADHHQIIVKLDRVVDESDQGGWQFILKDGDELKTIVGTGDADLDGDGNHVFIVKEDDSKADKSHRTLHRKVIVIKGDTEPELREQLKEQGFDLEFDLEPDEEETDEEVEK